MKTSTPQIFPFMGTTPRIQDTSFVAPGTAVIGDVYIGEKSSIWYNCTVRGDVHYIRIGDRTNVQDNSCIHVTRITHPTVIGDDVTIGHSVTLHGCTLENACFIGMKACVMDGAVVETGGMLAAGALLAPGKRVKSSELWAGVPAKYIRPLTNDEKRFIPVSADNYVRLAQEYLNHGN